jgi:hypothetical protein
MDLTRRALLGRAAAASGAVLGGSLLTPGVTFAGADGQAVFELSVPGGSRTSTGWRSGPIAPKRAFELVGVDGVPQNAEVRARSAGGGWGEWMPLHAAHGHGPDARAGHAAAERNARGLSDPVWVGPSQALELRASRSLEGARLVLVDGGRPARASAATSYVDAGLPAGPGQPLIIARSAWATTACKPRVAARFGGIDLAFVHHTVSTNHYRASQSAAMVRSICLFHKYGNGWNDIGYNFVVDRYGQVFEAREGGIDEAIVGAQAGGYNTFSTGIALLGNFTYGGPPRRAFDTLANLLAWKLALHGIELPGTITVTVSPYGAPYSRYRAGSHVHLNRISGHRDADATSCPGSGMYRQLPRLRQVVEGRLGTVSRLSLQLQVATPGNVTVGGLLADDLGPIAGLPVEVQRHSTTKPPVPLATATTNPDGTWAIQLPVAKAEQLRAVFRGDPSHAAAVAPNLSAITPPEVTLAAATQQTSPGGVIAFTGTTTPAKPKVTIDVSEQQPDGTFHVRAIRLNTADDGSFQRTIGFPSPGQYQVVAHTAADSSNALGTSAPVPITVA